MNIDPADGFINDRTFGFRPRFLYIMIFSIDLAAQNSLHRFLFFHFIIIQV